MNKPHILFVANTVLGWATYAEQFAAVLQARTDVQATVFRRRPSRWWMQMARRHADGGVKRQLRPCDPIRLHAGPLGRDIRNAIAEHRPDVVHMAAHWPAGAFAMSDMAPPFTLALDATRASVGSDLPLPGWSVKECAAEARLCREAARLFPLSTWAAQSLAHDYGIAAQRIHLCPPSFAVAPLPQSLPVREEVPQILFVGNDLKRKGAARLVHWVEGPLRGRCHLHLVSSDTVPPSQSVNITFHGRVPHDRLLGELMPRMDLFCLPTRLDMSPFVLVEAAAAGLPAVASDLGGIADLIDHGQTGFRVPTEDDDGFVSALSTLIDRPDLRQEMSQKARTLAADRFDGRKNLNRVVDDLVEIAVAARSAA